VKPGVRPPRSLVNIFKELKDDLGLEIPGHGNLVSWAEQGVLLLNAVLTVRAGEPNSHKGRGWEQFTDAIIYELGQRSMPMVFILWGAYAQKKKALINKHHAIIESAHPSPLSARHGFFGSRPFSKVNDSLKHFGHEPINWELPEI
jgi:uracil-DNA glycosylase